MNRLLNTTCNVIKDDEDVGDWEAEHDQLLLMEENGPLSKLESNRTPTKEDDSSSTSSSSTSSDDSLVKVYIYMRILEKKLKI